MSLQKHTRSLLTTTALILLLGAQAFAQYGPGMGGAGSPGTAGGYQPPKGGYSSSAGIAIGAAAAAGVGITYLALRNHGTIVGCVEPASDGVKLMNEKDQKTYSLVSDVALNNGDRVALRGKKSKNDSGAPTFQVSKLVKDYGSCKQQALVVSGTQETAAR
jgi:hypothetical protein